MLSVLIPTHNYKVYSLAMSLADQLSKSNINFEIICRDDNPLDSLEENSKINDLNNGRFIAAPNSIGLSLNRNTLAKEAQYYYLLFIDGDSMVLDDKFIERYIKVIDKKLDVIYGGRIHPEHIEPGRTLRWKYGKAREDLEAVERMKDNYKCLMFNNTIIKRSLFMAVGFDTTIKQYGHEDTLLAYKMSLKKVSVLHIDNPILHNDVDTNSTYLIKTKKSLENLNAIYNKQLIEINFVKLLKTYGSLEKIKLNYLLVVFHFAFKYGLKKQLLSRHPSLFIFDLYRLGYFCTINLKQ